MKARISVLALLLASTGQVTQADTLSAKEVMDTYVTIAHLSYTDALKTAGELDLAIDSLLQEPSKETLEAARQAWLAARVPYQQTEVYRFGNPIVDDWEGNVNAWPLDEGLIDYVDASYGASSDENQLYTANIVANPSVLINGQAVDAAQITPDLLKNELHEAGGIETNVATGYHAIEFLLWGQDLNGGEAGAGERTHTDFDTENCTNAPCDRRGEYLKAASTLLLDELQYMADAWAEGGEGVEALNAMGEEGALAAMLTGMGSLSYGELAGERMQLGLMLHDPEEEHDCFSDNTSASHYYDGVGIQNVYLGRYSRVDGSEFTGPGLQALLEQKDAALAKELASDLQGSVDSLAVLLDKQNDGFAYDQLIAEGNEDGNALVQSAIDALVAQTANIERAVSALELSGLSFEGSDSLDDPSAVFQ